MCWGFLFVGEGVGRRWTSRGQGKLNPQVGMTSPLCGLTYHRGLQEGGVLVLQK